MLLEITHSATLLLAFCWLKGFILQRLNLNDRVNQIISGVLFGIICITGMMVSSFLSSGLVIDPRNIILSLSGVFFGPIVAAIAFTIAGAYCLFSMDGVGAFLSVFLIFLSFLFGITFFYIRKKNWIMVGPWQLFVFGFMLHTAMGLLSITNHGDLAHQQIISTTVPIILAFSVTTMLIGLLLQEAEDRQKTANALSLSESQQRSIIDAIPDRLFVLDEEGCYVKELTPSHYAGSKGLRNLAGKSLRAVLQGDIADAAIEKIKKTVSKQKSHNLRYELSTKKGLRQFEAQTQPNATVINGKRTVIALVRDISEQHQHQRREQHLLKTQRALGEINEIILSIENESKLFALACKIAVEHGVALMAWVGIKDEKNERLFPTAWHGGQASFFQSLDVPIDPSTSGCEGPIGIAFREKRPVIVNDCSTDGGLAFWRKDDSQPAIRSGTVHPILRSGEPYAVFVTSSEHIDAFNDETLALLAQMARSLGFALDNFDHKISRMQSEIDLRASERRFRKVVHDAPFPMLIHTEKGNILLINDAWTKLTGYRRRDLPKRTRNTIKKLFRDKASFAMDDFRKLLADHHHISKEYTIYKKDGEERVCFFESSLLGNFADGSKVILSMAVDLTERRSVEKALKLTQFSVKQASFPIIWLTKNGRFHFVNEAACQTLGYSKDEFSKLSAPDISQAYSEEKWEQYWQELKAKKSIQFETINITKDKREIAVEVNANFLEYGGEEYNCAFIRDVTEKKKSEQIIWRQANYDSLTELPNRRMFEDRLDQEVRKSQRTNSPFAILFIDLDDFKDVNDTHGHDAGDALLRKVAQRLRSCVRDTDTVARLGGDEFTVIMCGVQGRAPIERVCSQILKSLSKPYRLKGEVAHISASIGITVYPDDATTVEELLVNADLAMYAAKQQGRKRYHYFTASMQKAAQNRKQMTRQLRSALGTDQFYIAYQPIVEIASGKIHKAEALVRWKHPKQGMINPSEFIALAEETGIIHELGATVFQIASAQAAEWRQKYNPGFQISVNMSPLQFRNDGKKSKIWSGFMKNEHFVGSSIVAEITEGMLLDASEMVINQLNTLRNAGLEVAIDDFGTGYSSLSYLKKFDIDYLKIDRSFVTGLTPESEDMAICEAIIVMAHKLGIKVIAEGIETPQQRDLLINAGCDYAQGFLFSRPVPAKEMEALF